jgi:hypothetical protein
MPTLPQHIQDTIDFAAQHYANKTTIVGNDLLRTCLTIARQSEIIAAKLYQDVRKDFFSDTARDSIAAITQTAILRDVLRVSDCTFENIAEISTVQVAAMVALITRDFRLVETKRDMEFRGRLSQSPIGAQIVVVAEVLCAGNEIKKHLTQHGLANLPRLKKRLTQLDGDLLAVHAVNKYYMLRLYAHAARNLLVEISQQIKELRQQAKAKRALELAADKIKKKKTAAAGKAGPAASPPIKKSSKPRKQVTYARKRALKPDSD